MLPKDPAILLSMINMKLRDNYDSLDSLCDDLDEDRESIENVLRGAGYVYSAGNNAFISHGSD